MSTTTTTTTTTTVTEESIEATLAAAVKAEETGGGSHNSKKDDPNDDSVTSILSTLKEHSDGTNIIQEYISIFRDSDGSNKSGDIMIPIEEYDKALVTLKQMVHEKLQKAKRKQNKKKIAMWEFRTSPHQQFKKTLDDTFGAFLEWAKNNTTEEDKEDKDDSKKNKKSSKKRSSSTTRRNNDNNCINVSKAFRRLHSYAEWMEATGNDLLEPLTALSVKKALDVWGMKLSIDKDGHVVWWVDFLAIDVTAMKQDLTPTDSLRAFVWYSHYLLFDKNAQQYGMVYVMNCDNQGFVDTITLAPSMKLMTKLDRLTFGVLPIKMHELYVFDTPKWITFFFKILGPFLSPKMKQRIILLKDNEWDKILPIVGSQDCIPQKFGKLQGNMKVDPVEATYFSKKEEEEE